MTLWLRPLHQLAGQFGYGAVEAAALGSLGFPAVLITGGLEVATIRKTLEAKAV